MENIHDKAHELANLIKHSEEFNDYKRLRNLVMKADSTKSMVEDFQKRQLELQKKQIMGEEITEKDQTKLQELYLILAKNPTANEYLMAEMKLGQIMADVSKIISDAIEME